MYSNNAEIDAAEARKSDLIAKKAKLDESLASARQFRALLQQQLEKAFQSQVGDQNTAHATIIWPPGPILHKESEDRGRLRQYAQWFCSSLIHQLSRWKNFGINTKRYKASFRLFAEEHFYYDCMVLLHGDGSLLLDRCFIATLDLNSGGWCLRHAASAKHIYSPHLLQDHWQSVSLFHPRWIELVLALRSVQRTPLSSMCRASRPHLRIRMQPRGKVDALGLVPPLQRLTHLYHLVKCCCCTWGSFSSPMSGTTRPCIAL